MTSEFLPFVTTHLQHDSSPFTVPGRSYRDLFRPCYYVSASSYEFSKLREQIRSGVRSGLELEVRGQE
jgi:hypothetical protein